MTVLAGGSCWKVVVAALAWSEVSC